MDAGCWNFDGATQRPSQFSLMREPQQPVAKQNNPKEVFFMILEKKHSGFITLKNLSGKGKIEFITVKARKKQKISVLRNIG